MAEAKIKELQDAIDSEVLRLRDLNIFICSKSCTDDQLKAFTKTYAGISNNIDLLENQIFKIKKGK